MIKIEERKKDVLEMFSKIDIPPTLYKNAIEKYENIAKYLDANGIEADIYIQGSFALGTVVRPYSKDKERGYDIDVICQLRMDRSESCPSETRTKIEDIIKDSELYGGKLIVCDECFTIEYADVNGYGFSIDIVPAFNEEYSVKEELKLKALIPNLLDTAIAIPQGDDEWITNNPLGYREWFEKINKPFKEHNKERRRQILFEAVMKETYSTIEEVPETLDRTPMQRVIQILKHHCNVYYANLFNGEKLKPISAIITTLVTKIAENASPEMDTYELLAFVLQELNIYSEYMKLDRVCFENRNNNRNVISKNDKGEWRIENPANPDDNLADAWNDKIAESFFQWVNIVVYNLLDSLDKKDEDYIVNIQEAFGFETVNHNIDVERYKKSAAETITYNQQKSPWRM